MYDGPNVSARVCSGSSAGLTWMTLPSRISAPHLHCTRRSCPPISNPRSYRPCSCIGRSTGTPSVDRRRGDLHLGQRALLVRRQHERMFAQLSGRKVSPPSAPGPRPRAAPGGSSARASGREDVDHAVEVVEQDPARLALALGAARQQALLLLQLRVDRVVDRLRLALGVARADHEEVRVAHDPAQVDHAHVVALRSDAIAAIRSASCSEPSSARPRRSPARRARARRCSPPPGRAPGSAAGRPAAARSAQVARGDRRSGACAKKREALGPGQPGEHYARSPRAPSPRARPRPRRRARAPAPARASSAARRPGRRRGSA